MPNESVDDFILSLHCLVQHCRFGALKEEIIRDRLVMALADVSLFERLQMAPNLTLQRAIESARNSEVVKRQRGTIRNTAKSYEIKTVRCETSHSSKDKGCLLFGGYRAHQKSRCRANNSRCFNCGKLGHFKKLAVLKLLNLLKRLKTYLVLRKIIVGRISTRRAFHEIL